MINRKTEGKDILKPIHILLLLSIVISLTLLYQNIGNLTLSLISPDSSFFFQALQVFFPFVFLLFNPLTPLFTLGSSNKLYIRAYFSISLCTEYGMLNVTENAVCNFSVFYWCCICCSITRYF